MTSEKVQSAVTNFGVVTDPAPEESMVDAADCLDFDHTEPDEAPYVPVSFEVRDAGTANWVVKRINECRAYQRRVDAWAEREKARARREEEFFFFRFGRQLQEWASQEIEKLRGRRKSVCLPGGMLGFRHEGMKLVIDNEQAVVEWATKSYWLTSRQPHGH